jgi:hypothetical protein
MISARIEELIEAFDRDDGIYKRDEMEEALTLREEITPHLIRILEELIADPQRYADEDHYANVYAVALLAHFQEPAAFEPIIRAFRIPDEQREVLWGDMVTETLPALLLQTCHGRVDTLKALIIDQEAPEYVRGAGVDALSYASARNMIPREEVIAFLSGLFTGMEADGDSYFWSNVACAISDLHPAEAMDVIRQAYADELIHPGYVGLAEIERDLASDPDELLAKFRDLVDRRIPGDVHDYLTWFAYFNEKKHARPTPSSFENVRLQQQKAKKVNRAKNKLAKKSRKNNRR